MYKIESKRYNVLKYFQTAGEAYLEMAFLKRWKLIQKNAVIHGAH